MAPVWALETTSTSTWRLAVLTKEALWTLALAMALVRMPERV
jgi:hypothetical protein